MIPLAYMILFKKKKFLMIDSPLFALATFEAASSDDS